MKLHQIALVITIIVLMETCAFSAEKIVQLFSGGRESIASDIYYKELKLVLLSDLKSDSINIKLTDKNPQKEGLRNTCLNGNKEYFDAFVNLVDQNQANSILIEICFPESKTHISRVLKSENDSGFQLIPIASIIAQMLRAELVTKSEETKPQKINLPSTKTANYLKKEDKSGKVALDLYALYAYYPEADLHGGGAQTGISYFPVSPVAFYLGFAVLTAQHSELGRFDTRLIGFPLWAGGRYFFDFDEHELDIYLSLLADINKVSISDKSDLIGDSYTRVNFGVKAGAGWTYYPLDFMGIALNFSAQYTPRSQEYYAYNQRIFHLPSVSVNAAAGLVFDFLR